MIQDSFTKAHSVLSKHDRVICAISGGADSDVMMDICSKLDPGKKITYAWFDTGVEFAATKEHLIYLEKKYGIQIQRVKAKKPIPVSCKKYGQPFMSKQVSEFMFRLQQHGFDWSDKPYEELVEEYPKCIAALKWWCNKWGDNATFNIARNKLLKEFIVENPPAFAISNKCCKYAKKEVARSFIESGKFELNIYGVRKAEGGARTTAYKNCYDADAHEYRPLFWYSDADKEEYCKWYGIKHSDCYEKYGLTRTGCVGCPYARNLYAELEATRKNEPMLYKAACHIFKDSYEYTKAYEHFRRYRETGGQLTIDDLF